MKFNNILYSAAALAMTASLCSCEGEKDLVIIEGNLPIKTSVLYMVGNATPNGWDIDNPTPFEATGEDPLVFTWQGNLLAGEMKLCLVTGSWDSPFIRPEINGSEIGREPIVDAAFQMHAGDPDNKWIITEAGVYSLTFDLRNWTMSSAYLGEADKPAKEPIKVDRLFVVGDATPNGWNIDTPTACEKKSDYIFEYEGKLTAGEFKAVAETGSWDAKFIRPAVEGVKLTKVGFTEPGIVYTTSPDNKWTVTDAGIYHIVFDLENCTVTATFTADSEEPGEEPGDVIETETLYLIGDATPGGWSMDNLTAMTQSDDDKYLFIWEGTLVSGDMKACIEPDGSFGCPFLRPTSDGCTIGKDGVQDPAFIYTKSPDDKWKIVDSGRYRIEFNLKEWTIKATFLD